MSTRVLSIRFSYNTIAYCYLLQEVAGRNVKGKPVSTVVGDTVDAIIEASRKLYNVPEITSDEEAMSIIDRFVDRVPGFDAPDVIAEIQKAAAQKQGEGGNNGKTRPTESSVATMPGEQAERSEAPEPDQRPTENVSHEFVYAGKTVGRMSTQGTIDAEAAEAAASGDTERVREDEFAEGAPTREPVDVESAIEKAAQAEEEKERQALLKKVNVGVVERTTPDEAPAEIPKCPWLNMQMVSEAAVEEDALYKAAKEEDELMALAVRGVYFFLNKEAWSTEKSISMIKKLYKSFKEWEEKYGSGKTA